MTPLLILWQVALPTTELRSLSTLLLIVAAAAIVLFVARDFRTKPPRVLILGSGPMASKLIEAIETPRRPLYTVAGVVDDVRPDADTPAEARWLGPSDRLADIVEQIRPACIVVAVGDRRQGFRARRTECLRRMPPGVPAPGRDRRAARNPAALRRCPRPGCRNPPDMRHSRRRTVRSPPSD
jgi:FlaA1/EpsC-like NDP-sugar epimerase